MCYFITAGLPKDRVEGLERHVPRGLPSAGSGGRLVAWSHPALANRCVYVRNNHELICVSLAAASGPPAGEGTQEPGADASQRKVGQSPGTE